mgnify:CR=1 FL=1
MYKTLSLTAVAVLMGATSAIADERAGATVRVQPDSYQRSGFFPFGLDVGDEIYQEAKVIRLVQKNWRVI